jgi:hypothetical protein
MRSLMIGRPGFRNLRLDLREGDAIVRARPLSSLMP